LERTEDVIASLSGIFDSINEVRESGTLSNASLPDLTPPFIGIVDNMKERTESGDAL
jgi:hypothetical protein